MSQNLWTHIRTVTDFPKAGIEFYDISPLLNRHLNQLIDALIHALPSDILAATDAFVAVESRGFVLATGGTLVAADKLCKTAGLTALGSLVLLDLTELHGDLGLKYWCVLSK